jgi:hypothetical protein
LAEVPSVGADSRNTPLGGEEHPGRTDHSKAGESPVLQCLMGTCRVVLLLALGCFWAGPVIAVIQE